jgi:3-phosphoshikimate 1-carboxyvinyltransferase
MKAIIEPGGIAGSVLVPPSKSYTQRAYAAALLHHGTTTIKNNGNSNDELAALQLIQQLGAQVERNALGLTISSNGVAPITSTVSCGESGLAARLFAPIAALSEQQITLTGEGTLLRRSMNAWADVLPSLGVTLGNFNGYLPCTMYGPLQSRSISVDASGGSQFPSGLLFALGFTAREPLTLSVTNLKSKPYIDMTLDVLQQFGIIITHERYRQFYIPAYSVGNSAIEINVEADWSSAAFFMVAGAIAGDITLKNLNADSKQADSLIADVLRSAGADIVTRENEVQVKCSAMNEFDFDATDCPDLFPALSILGACARGESQIKGVHRLFDKESNRVESVTEMLFDFGVPFSVEEDTLFVTGVEKLQGTVVDSFHDHRIAMAASIGALRAGSRVDVLHAEAVNKSYPAFFEHLQLCGAKCTFINE